ncbi:surface glycoprotein [Volepox virus]|uniref:Surface glycoprotein n=1 Tax=Volepox virus TaxID=28874 RepID=A0A1C9KC13_9POXV|nr:surface glycoprotein [Volepox virus]AOP31694.1 surface glycoprotein [Volepox virus]
MKHYAIDLIIAITTISSTTSLECYRKSGFYNLYGSNDNEYENAVQLSVSENYDYLLKTETLNIDNNIPWKNITDYIYDSFITSKCNNCSDNTIYNVTIQSWTNYTLVNVTENIYLNVSSDISMDENGTTNNTVNGDLSINVNNNLVIINLMNISFIINSTNCEGITVKKAIVTYVNNTLIVYTESEPVSVIDPFITLDELYNCSFSKPINYINSSRIEEFNKTICKNNPEYNSMYETYTIGNNITFIRNITSITKYINSCANSSINLQILAVGIPEIFNETMKHLDIDPGSDSDAYFMCRVTGYNCDLSILLNKASKNVMNKLSKKSKRQRRSTHTTGNHFCLHKNYGLEIHDCDSYIDNRDTTKVIRTRRSPVIKSLPIDPNDVLVFKAMDELGARPKIPRHVTDIQVGYSGTDSSVMGARSIYESIRGNIYHQIRSKVISNNRLDASQLPIATRTILENVIESKMDTVDAARQVVSSITNVENIPNVIYEKIAATGGLIIDSEKYATGLLDIPTSTRLSSREQDDKLDNNKRKSGHSLIAYSVPNKGKLETIYEEDRTNYNAALYKKNHGGNHERRPDYNIYKEPMYKYGTEIRNNRRPDHIGVRRSSSGSVVTRFNNHRKNINVNDFTYKQYKNTMKGFRETIADNSESTVYDVVRPPSKKEPIYDVVRSPSKDEPIYDDVGISEGRKSNLRRSNAFKRTPGDIPHVNKRDNTIDSICSSTSRSLICNIREQSNTAGRTSLSSQSSSSDNRPQINNENIYDRIIPKISNNNNKMNTQLNNLAGKNNRMNTMMKSVSLSAQSSFNSARISTINKDNTPKAQKIISLVATALNQIGGSLAIAGGPKGAVAGVAIQTISGLIDVFSSIYFILAEGEPPLDPAIEKFSTYTQHMETKEAGSISCLMPDSQLTITLAYRHKEMNVEAEKSRGEYTDIIPSKVYYLKNSFISYTSSVKLICPFGRLRLFEADVNAYASLITEKNGVKHYIVHGIMELLSYHSTATFTCGNEPGVIFIPFEQKLSDMQLLKLTTPGEPESTKDIPSNVCDLYPLKRLYLLAGNCPHDMTQTAITYVTCGTLLRMTTYQEDRNRWVLMNPFHTTEGENIQLFTFSKYDFSDIQIDVNKIQNAESLCTQVENNNCFWSEAMMLEDVTECASRIRKMYITLSTISVPGYNSFILTCPSGSAPFVISNSSISAMPMNTRRTSMRFASDKDATALVSCMHNSNPSLKSDIIHLTFTSKRSIGTNYKNYNNELDKLHLFKYTSTGMPYRSTHCKRLFENASCKYHRYHIGKWKPAEYRFTKHKLPMIRLTTNYHGELNNNIVSKMKKYFSSPIRIKIDIRDIDKVYDNPDRLWIFAKKGLRTFSAITVTMFPCSVIAGNINIVDFSHLPISDTKDSDGYYARYIFTGSIERPNGNHITFTYRKEHKNNAYAPYGKCEVYIDIDSKELNINCPEFTIPIEPFNNESVNNFCVATVTSRDHCTVTTTWGGGGKWGYTSSGASLEFNSCYYHSQSEPTDNFCYYYHLSTYYPPEYDACGSAMIVAHAPIFVESRIISPPYIKEFVYDTSNNEYVSRTVYNKVKTLYDEYNRLIDMTSNTIIDMSNNFGNGLTDKGREIFRLNADYMMLTALKEENKYKMEALKNEIEDTLNDIFIKSMTYDDITSILRSAINTRCCVIEGTNVYKYYHFEKYLCGEYNDYIKVIDDNRYLLVNNTLIDEKVYNVSNVPIIACFEISLIPITKSEQKEELETILFKTALEEVITELFTEYDRNLTSELEEIVTYQKGDNIDPTITTTTIINTTITTTDNTTITTTDNTTITNTIITDTDTVTNTITTTDNTTITNTITTTDNTTITNTIITDTDTVTNTITDANASASVMFHIANLNIVNVISIIIPLIALIISIIIILLTRRKRKSIVKEITIPYNNDSVYVKLNTVSNIMNDINI